MCIHKKILNLREQFYNSGIEKKGYNTYSKFYYYRLQEIAPVAEALCKAMDLFTLVTFFRDDGGIGGKMMVLDIESKETLEITSGSGTAKLTACHDIQNTGAVQTYVRRYLWATLLDMVETEEVEPTDDIDGLPGKPDPLPETKAKKEIKTPPVKKEEKKTPKPKKESPAPANYNIHFMNQIAKTGKMKDIMEMIPKIYSKKAADMTVSEKKVVLAALMADFPEAGITTG